MASTGEVWKLGHRPALDGLRGIAILLVMLFHAEVPGFTGAGTVGVTAFFTLSGFLITSLLLDEHRTSGRIDLRGFYLRRARRLFPAAGASVLACVLVAPLVAPWFVRPSDLVAVVVYVANWGMAYTGTLGAFGGMWSLAVEEQFYLAWPLVLIAAVRFGGRRVVLAVSLMIAAASNADRVWIWASGGGWNRFFFGTDSRVDALLIGCALAAAMHQRPNRAPRLSHATAALVALVGLGSLMGDDIFLLQVTPLVTAALIFTTTQLTEPPRVLTWRPLLWTGRRSYGLYLWHCPLSIALHYAYGIDTWWMLAALLFPASFALAAVSWRLIEEPFLRRRGSDHVEVVDRKCDRGAIERAEA